jgi:hypothetical protein
MILIQMATIIETPKSKSRYFTENEIKVIVEAEVKKVLAEANKMYFAFTYDRENILYESKENPSMEVKDHIEKICEGNIVVKPDFTTYIFYTMLDVNIVINRFIKSKFISKLSYSLYPIGRDLNRGLINKPKTIINNDVFNKDYKPKS